MELNERRISGQTLFEGRIFNVERDEVALPDGSQAMREVVRHTGGVGIAALTDKREIILVRQYRYGAGKVLLEIPAGKLEPGESPMVAGIRELKEETGYAAAEVRTLGRIIPSPAYLSEVIYLYLAKGLTSGECRLDEGEFVEVEAMPLTKAADMVLSGEIEDSKTAVAVLKLQMMADRGML